MIMRARRFEVAEDDGSKVFTFEDGLVVPLPAADGHCGLPMCTNPACVADRARAASACGTVARAHPADVRAARLVYDQRVSRVLRLAAEFAGTAIPPCARCGGHGTSRGTEEHPHPAWCPDCNGFDPADLRDAVRLFQEAKQALAGLGA
jgi:hypothetical protein